MDAHESGDYELVRRSWQGNDSQVWGFELVVTPTIIGSRIKLMAASWTRMNVRDVEL